MRACVGGWVDRYVYLCMCVPRSRTLEAVLEIIANDRFDSDCPKYAASRAATSTGILSLYLSIALYMVVSLYFGGKSHVSNGQNVFFKEP